MSNLAQPARKSVTGVDANHLMCCLFSDTSSFMMFSSFSSAVLLLHDWTWSICTTPGIFLGTRSSGTRLAATWYNSRWHCEGDLHDLFSFKSFCICSKNQKNKWVDRTSTKPKGKFFIEFTLSSKYWRKCNRFSIVIVNKLHDDWSATDGRGLKWCTKLDKRFVLIYFYLLHKIGSCSTMHFLCCYANYLTWKQKVLCIMHISILEAKFAKKSVHYTQVNTVYYVIVSKTLKTIL